MFEFIRGTLCKKGTEHCVVDVNGVGSVSYTHLDVYKRQKRISPAATGAGIPESWKRSALCFGMNTPEILSAGSTCPAGII